MTDTEQPCENPETCGGGGPKSLCPACYRAFVKDMEENPYK